MRVLLASLLVALFLVPVFAAEDDAWAIHAQVELSTQDATVGLKEVYLPMGLEETPLFLMAISSGLGGHGVSKQARIGPTMTPFTVPQTAI